MKKARMPDWVWRKWTPKPKGCHVCGATPALYYANAKVFCRSHKDQAVKENRMKRMVAAIIAVLFTLGMADAQGFFLVKPGQDDPASVTYIVVMGVRVADSSVSYLMNCSESHPDCNTVYRLEYRYVPFTSQADALAYLNTPTKDVFVRLVTVKTASVVATETTTSIRHPDTVEKSIHYSIAK